MRRRRINAESFHLAVYRTAGKAGETQKARAGDKNFLSLLVSFQDKTTKADVVAEALSGNSCSATISSLSTMHTWGVHRFVCDCRPSKMSRSPLYLKALWEADHVETADVLAWEQMTYTDVQAFCLQGTRLRKSTSPNSSKPSSRLHRN